MNTIDEDAINVLGINEKLWKEFRENKPVVEQPEFPEIVDAIDDKEAFLRHKESMRKRWFEYYKKCSSQKKKFKLIDGYNFLAQSRGR